MYNTKGRAARNALQEHLKDVSVPVSDRVLTQLISSLHDAIQSPLSGELLALWTSGDHDAITRLKVDPAHYSKASAFADDHLIVSVLSKYKYLNVSFDPEQVALTKFLECEETCRLTNKRLTELDLDPSQWDPAQHAIFCSARRKINRLLGDVDLDRISQGFGWGPGATSASHGSKTTVYDKFAQRLDVTSNCFVMGKCCVNSIPSWVSCQLVAEGDSSVYASLMDEAFTVIRGNEVVFVPKNAKTHRTIAIEPHVNSYLQKGFGRFIRKRLKHFAGIDLDDQTINQRLAMQGSRDGLLATLDLSSASDTISKELVKLLLPHRWFNLLDLCRSKQGFVKSMDTWLNYEKFSSMGNGFTFELESLIFWALCKSCVEYHGFQDTSVSVYGDDLIVSSESAEEVANTLSFAGFSLNKEKSFSSGPFRESCGKDYFEGHEVRPFFIKERIANVEMVYKLANSIRRYSYSGRHDRFCDIRFLDAWNRLVGELSPRYRNVIIPDGYGDGGLIGNFDEATPVLANRSKGWCGYFYKTLARRPLKRDMRDWRAGFVSTLSVVGSEEPLLGQVAPRNSTFPVWAQNYTFDWRNLGPWQ